tara:strand:- start:378 stop:587 length:210 start_codon:yes stop_codon:yes gene_type:complete
LENYETQGYYKSIDVNRICMVHIMFTCICVRDNVPLLFITERKIMDNDLILEIDLWNIDLVPIEEGEEQ